MEKYIIIGKLGKTHGVKGWLRLHSNTRPTEAMLNYSPWYIQNDESKWQKLVVNEIRPHGKIFIVNIEGVENPEVAKQYTGKDIATIYSQLPKSKKDEYYWTDLEGMTVVNCENVELGTIDHLMETGANDVMVVIGKKRHLIPFLLKKVVLEVDLENKMIRVDWDEDF